MEVDMYVLIESKLINQAWKKIYPEKCTNQLLNDVFGSISAFFEDFPLIENRSTMFFAREHHLKYLIRLLTFKTN